MEVPDTSSHTQYRGRFAPSPTGPLHAGSVLTALASFLDARANAGSWLVRIEDLDPPRESQEAADEILRALEALGLHWDEQVLFQSQRADAYAAALARLTQQNLVFACNCSRQSLARHGPVYPGICREKHLPLIPGLALRCRVPAYRIVFPDAMQGEYSHALEQETGDFVIRRRDGLFAYQLAVVVDDGWQDITHVVRGLDLLDSTPRQIWLQRCLGLPQLHYAHLPLVVDAQGQKLSKQQHANPVDYRRPVPVLLHALRQLAQAPDPALADAGACEILDWAVQHWNPAKLAGIRTIPEIAGPRSTGV